MTTFRQITIITQIIQIKQEYKSDDCSTEDYIKEVMELNSLATNEIHESQHLMIVYYDIEFR